MLQTTILIVTGVLVSLLAGVFFAFTVSVNGGLRRLKDLEYVRAMQSINSVIQNPLFLGVFMLPVILLPWVTFMFWNQGGLLAMLLLTTSILYIVGSFGVTVAGNVPLNEKLARATETEASAARVAFEKPWNRLHTIRTLASVAATILLFIVATL